MTCVPNLLKLDFVMAYSQDISITLLLVDVRGLFLVAVVVMTTTSRPGKAVPEDAVVHLIHKFVNTRSEILIRI